MEQQSQKICVCGAGTMGAGIAQAFALSGFQVTLYDTTVAAIDSAKNKIRKDLDHLLQKNRISSVNEIVSNIAFTASLQHCVADVIVEAVVENSSIKSELFNRLAAINAAGTVFATNTSSLSVTGIAKEFSRPGQFAGMHFFNPATVMKLVEVIQTPSSSPETISVITALVRKLGKTPVLCQDSPGFIVNHVARPFYLEALYLAEKYHVEMEQVDALMESAGFKMGPFRLMDLIGNDINYAVSCVVYDALGRPARLMPSMLQQEKVNRGELGKKTGRGYYAYNQ